MAATLLSPRRLRLRHPAQFVVAGFATTIAIGTLLLLLPVSAAGPGRAPFLVAVFTATSATCVTGLIVVDTPVYWTGFGETVILVLIQVGGFGIMTVGSLIGLLLSRRIGLRQRMTAQAERNALELGGVREVLLRVAGFSLAFEALAAVIITLRLWTAYDEPIGRAARNGIFHAVSAFNNAGFSLYSDNLIGFVSDPWICLTIAFAIILGGIGFPVLNELKGNLHDPTRWSLHTKLTLATTGVLLVVGTLAFIAFEWTNPATFGDLDTADSLLASFFQGVQPRTAGFNSVDTSALNESTLLVSSALMLIGAGSASTGGGIKVTTFALLAFVIWSETRGDPEVSLFGRRMPSTAQRQALSVALLGLGAGVIGTFVLLSVADVGMGSALYESFSAFGTVGLSTGITPALPELGQLALMGLMFLGRVGPITLFAALVLRQRQRLYRFPEERPIIG
ncbi:MAG: KtrAB potassium uptake system, integral membrane component KtrB [uncultured Acidimicrobiales bacterium]|uniref:KtrAB potassium uptake system, integral membrane component KtrB n=1 Tax=uncultured Acidimicrobiales bacterium TaxID=310071 RepID=A0A6J4I0P8_9ACTN|nr:MAG: KtrAB potassium uptake system, integral membrane component KtrB [uncultured Acidimicrobiales bacterium]